MDGVPNCFLVQRGPKATVAYATTRNGKRLAQEFLTDPERRDQDLACISRIVDRLCDVGRISNTEKMESLGRITVGHGRHLLLWELKSKQVRVLAFQDGSIYWLTHGFLKKRNGSTPSNQLERAASVAREHLTSAPKQQHTSA